MAARWKGSKTLFKGNRRQSPISNRRYEGYRTGHLNRLLNYIEILMKGSNEE